MFDFQKIAMIALALACSSCAISPPVPLLPPLPEEPRPHDSRVFTVPAISGTFAAMTALPQDVVNMATSSRWSGVLKGSAYMVEEIGRAHV